MAKAQGECRETASPKIGDHGSDRHGSGTGLWVACGWPGLGGGWQSMGVEDVDQVILGKTVGEIPRHASVDLGASGRRRYEGGVGQIAGIRIVGHPVGNDGLGAGGVRKHRERQFQLFHHGGVLGGSVDVYRRGPEPGGEYLLMVLGQAGQLAVTVWSPIAAQEH